MTQVPGSSGLVGIASEAHQNDDDPVATAEAVEPLSHEELKSARLHQGIQKRLNAATNGDDVFRVAEDIPAITRNTDKAISIASASIEDAEDAVLAIQRLASLSVELNNWALTTNDRRFEQLSDCVELGLSDISSMELCKYLWSISVLGLSDEERARAVFREYLARIEAPEKTVSEGEMATMMWTVGCVMNNFGWTDDTLMAKLTEALLKEPLDSVNRGGRLLVRILWTLTVHKDSIDSSDGRRLGHKVLHILDIGNRHEELSSHHISTMVLAAASLRVMRDEDAAEQLVDFFSQALSILKVRIAEESLSVSELDLTASALTELYDELQYLSQSQKVSSIAADEAWRRPVSSIGGQLEGLLEEVRSTAESLLSSGLHKISQLDVESCASLMKIVVTVLPRGELSTDFIDAAAARLEVFVESWHAQHYCWSPTDAASLLESTARMTWNMRGEGPSGDTSSIGVHGKDRLGVQLMQAKHRRSTSEQRERSDSDQDPEGDQQWGKFTPFQRWQRLAGICSSICSSQADNINDAPLLVASAWSCVSYNRPCSLLASEVKQRLPSLDFGESLDPRLLARLASVIVSSHGSGGKSGPKEAARDSGFDAEHFDRVSQELLPSLKFIPSLSERISAIISFAILASSSSSVAAVQDKSHIEHASIDFNVDKLRDVRSRVLLRFLQADVPKSEEMDSAIKKTLRKRKVDPTIGYTHLSPLGEHTEHATRLSLLAKLMKDWHHHSKGGRRDDRLLGALIDSTKEAIREMLPSFRLQEMEGTQDEEAATETAASGLRSGEDTSTLGDSPSRTAIASSLEDDRSDSHNGDEQEELWTGADLVALGDALHVIAVHNWKDDELEALVNAVIATAIDQCDENNHSSSGHRHLYDIGRVEGSLQLYRLAKHTDRSPKAFFGFASGVARKYIPKIKEALVSVLGDRGD